MKMSVAEAIGAVIGGGLALILAFSLPLFLIEKTVPELDLSPDDSLNYSVEYGSR